MSKIQKFSSLNGNIWVGSDFHLNHDKDFVWGKRGFVSVQEHDRFILDAFKEMGSDDVLIYLGDFSLNSSVGQTQAYLNAILASRIFYINGNHESFIQKIEFDNERISSWGNLKEVSIDNQHVILCHYPLAIWNHVAHGAMHLHGHCHGAYAAGLPESQEGKILDVGVEVAMKAVKRPFFNWKEILDIMSHKNFVKKDHHG